MEKTLKHLEILYRNGAINFEEYREILDEYKASKAAVERIEESVINQVRSIKYASMSENEYKRIKKRLENSKAKYETKEHTKTIIKRNRLFKAFEDGDISDDDFKRFYKNIKQE